MRVYPVKIKDEETNKEESRISIDVEDLMDEIISLELGNPNILENWYSIKVRLIELLSSRIETPKEEVKEEVKK